MAKYRQIQTDFWSDGFILDLEPKEKFFYIYLMTNSSTKQCGIYELPLKIVQAHTGFSSDTIIELLRKFEEYGKIIYSSETKEIMIKNWSKYNAPKNLNSIKCVNGELKGVKNKDLIKILYKEYQKFEIDSIDNVFEGTQIDDIEDQNNCSGLSIEFIKDEDCSDTLEEDNELQDLNENDNIDKVSLDNLKKLYCEAINNKITKFEIHKLKEWSTSYEYKIIKLAFEEAIKQNVRNIKYIDKILSKWNEQNLNTYEDVVIYIENWNKSKKENNSEGKTLKFCDFDQRDYDQKYFDNLEDKLVFGN